MSWEDKIKKESQETFTLRETAKMVEALISSGVGSENQSMSAKDVERFLKDIKANILKVREKLQ
tara:strand:- start:905 stop:1096 length:192 start_codon:yes stop_codon:yes gene_type:complete